MKKLFIILTLFVAVKCLGQVKDNRIVIGTWDTLNSKVLNEQRKFSIYLPPSYRAENKNLRFPVLYLLDGDAHFHSVSGLVQQLAGGVNGNTLFPELIIIAIHNTDRTRDLTPIADRLDPNGKEVEFLKTSGGAENFVRFLKLELIPYVERTYNTAPYRLLVGHSFGGLFAMHVLLNHTEMFNSYIAIDPSMWWAKNGLLKQAETIFAEKKFNGHSLYLGIANTLPMKLTFDAVDKDTMSNTAHIRSIKNLVSIVEKNKSNGLRFSWQYYGDDDHGSVPLIAEYHGLRYIFDGYRMSEEKALAGIESLVNHYKSITEMMGYTILPPEGLVNMVGYFYLQAGEIDKAIAHFSLNVKNYPSSSNAYDSLGDAYLAKGDKVKAREEFQMAVKVDPANTMSKEKLDKLK